MKHAKRRRPTPPERNRKPRQEKATLMEKAAREFDLPVDITAGLAHLEFSGNREAVVDGCKGILEYDENVIRINIGKMIVRFCGRGLLIRNLSQNSAVIEGYIASVEFLT